MGWGWGLAVVVAASLGCGGGGDGGSPAGGSPDAAAARDPDAGGGQVLTIETRLGPHPVPVGFVAVQDGDGAWRRLTSDDGRYSTAITTGRYGALVACGIDTSQVDLAFLFATMAEKRSWTWSCADDLSGGALAVEVHGLADGESAGISVAGGNATVFGPSARALFDRQRPGLHDVFVSQHEPIRRLTAVRDVEVEHARETTAVVDIADATPLGPGLYSVNVAGPDAGDFETRMSFTSRHGARASVTASDGRFAPVPAALVRDGDMYVAGFNRRPGVPITVPNRYGGSWSRELRDVSFEIPPLFDDVIVTVAGSSPYPLVELDASYPGLSALDFGIGRSFPDRFVRVRATVGWLGEGPRVRWSMPDLTGTDGWEHAWTLTPGSTADWFATAITVEGGLFDFLDRDGVAFGGFPAAWDGRSSTGAEARGVVDL